MRRFFKRYLPFTRGAYESFMEYRARMVLWILAEFFSIAITYFIWVAVYSSQNNTQINGYTLTEILAYTILTRVVQYSIFINPHWMMANDIQTGNIAMSLIKPINYQVRLFFHGLGDILISLTLFVLPFLGITWIITLFLPLQLNLAFYDIGYFLVSLVFALFINFFTSFIFGSILFFTINSFGIWQLKDAIELIFSGSLIPLIFYPTWLYQIAVFLPFAQARYFPILILLGKTENGPLQALLIQGAWAIGLYLIAQGMWHLATKRIAIQGG